MRTGSEFYERTCPFLRKNKVYIWTGSWSCENLRSVFSPVLTFKSVNLFSLWEPGQHFRTGMLSEERTGLAFENRPTLDWTKIPCFIDCENSKVNRRHLYEWCRKTPVQTELRGGRNGWTKLTIQYNLHKIIQISSIFGQKKITAVSDCSQPCCVLSTLYELTPLTCSWGL